MVFGVYRVNHPPSAVDHCCHCYFVSSKEPNLVVSGGSLLRVFRYVPIQEDGQIRHRLEQVLSYNLYGVINSLAACRYPGNKRHSLLIAVGEAQLSVVDYDPSANDIKTRMLYNYEQDEQRQMFLQQTYVPQVRVDSENRSAAMLIYGSHLVVVPLIKPIKNSSDTRHHSYVIDLKQLDEKVNNVKDFQFLEGYCEPTILLLYEPLRTWAGRIAVRRDTCAIVAIALNITERVHPIIWSQGNLPFDSLYTLPVPRPTGGVLVFAVNSLMYLNQSVPPFGVLLNSIAPKTTDFPLQKQSSEHMLTLDDSQAVMMAGERVLLSLKSGDIYLVTLFSDGMRSVKKFSWNKAATSVLTSCVCMAAGNYIFLGSRMGNSILLYYQEKSSVTANFLEEQSNKRQRMDDDDLDLEIFGPTEQKKDVTLSTYNFEVCDSLMNFAPITQMTVGEAPFLSEEYRDSNYIDLEIVACSGFGKNGALSILQNSVRPLVNSTFDDLPTVHNMWTVYGADGDPRHKYLVLAKSDSTLVLQTGDDITELDTSGFNISQTSLYVANLDQYTVQVCANSILLLQGPNLVHMLELNKTIASATISEPYGVVLYTNGQVQTLSIANAELVLTDTTSNNVVCITSYVDESGLFTTRPIQDETQGPVHRDMSFEEQPTPSKTEPEKTVEELDEDALLYGDSVYASLFKKSSHQPTPEFLNKAEPVEEPGPPMKSNDNEASYWCCLSREDGALEIRALPSWTLLYFCKNFAMSPKVLVHSDENPSQGSEGIPHVKELALVGMGWKRQRPHVIALIDDDLFIYSAFPYNSEGDTLKLRFSKLSHEVLIKRKKSRTSKLLDMDPHPHYTPRIYNFANISGYSGVFLCGDYPYWLFLTTHGALRTHPMYVDGKVTSFAPFNNVNCENGFLYFSANEELRVCTLPTTLSYDNPWAARKINLRATPHFIGYHYETKTYAVCTSHPSLNPNMPKMLNNLDKDEESIDESENFPYPSLNWYSIQLYTRDGWEVIPNTRVDFPKYERVSCMKYMQLSGEQIGEQSKGYIVVGTISSMGEEVSSRGKIIIFDVMDVVPDPEKPLSGFKFKCLYDKEQKGPVTQIESIMGQIVSAIGQKIYVWSFINNDLTGVAFIDTQIFIHSISVIKNFVLYADITKSISILNYDKQAKTLSLISRDFQPMEIYTCNFVVDGPNLGFIVSDANCNLIIYSYQPESVESSGGQKLVRKSDINIGSHVNSFFRTGIRLQDGSILGSTPSSALLHPSEKRHVTWFATLDGSIGSFLPLSEKRFRRLLMLHNKLVSGVPHVAGLNPKKFRTAKMPGRWLMNPHRNILDFHLLCTFLALSHTERRELSKQIGTSPGQILDDLMGIQRAMMIF